MSLRSVYIPEPAFKSDTLSIIGEEHRHLTVARAERNELLEVFDGKGNVWEVSVESVGKNETVVRLLKSRPMPRGSIELILAMAMIRIAAFELALEKAVEVGVTRIVPFAASRSNLAPGSRHDRWLRIVIEAAKQSKRYYLPALDEPMTLKQVLSIPAASKIMFAERDGGPLKSALAGSPALYLIGPEGGWSDQELAAAREQGFHTVSLGAAILKAETAAIVGGSLIRYELGE
ncbi:MAG TPA: RsmE family RNA methyltransferase [Terriglobia bacterium]|nr:RsmE family RNA methyltransferase [Terriglobia bacterium]